MSVEELRKEIEDIKAQLRSSDEVKRAEAKKNYEEFRKKHGNVYLPGEQPGPEPGPEDCGPDPDPNNKHVKVGGWGGDTASPKTWSAVTMKDDPKLYKVVDAAGKNIAHKFASKAEADTYIGYHICQVEKGGVDPTPVPTPTPTPTPTPGPGTPGTTPYPIKGTPMQSTQRGPTTRHYASGKPDDETIEKNVKGINFENYQWVTYTTMHKIEHDDTISVKFGGHHTSGNGWWDCGISFQGQTCLGTEPNHPSTNLCIVKGPKLGSVIEKKVGVAGVVFTKTGKIELWIDMGDGWKKAIEGTNVGGLKPKMGDQECQLRIDGFAKDSVPTIHSAIVTEIAGDATPAPAPTPTPPTPTPEPTPTPTPAPAGSSTTKDGVAVPVKIKGAWDYTVREDWRDGGARFNMKAAGTQFVMVGYFTATKDGGDEVSAKVLGGRHTDSAKYQGCMYDLGAPVGGGKARMRCECPHPTYTSTLNGPQVIKAETVDSIVGKYKGFMAIVTQEAGKVRLKWFQDVGPNETKPANQWKQIYEYLDDGKNLSGIDAKFFPIVNLDHTEGTAQNTWRIDETPGLAQKWCAIAETA